MEIDIEKDFPSHLPKLRNLYEDLFAGGKGFRARLVSEVSEYFDHSQENIDLLCRSVEYMHNASLLHDDLIDQSPLRRNKTSAWLKYSAEYAVLAGDFLLARVIYLLSQTGNLKLVEYTSVAIGQLVEGEWLQDAVIEEKNRSLEKLNLVHDRKTSSLIKWCLRAPFYLENQNEPKLHELLDLIGSQLGILFQRADDLLDFNIRNQEGKALLGDLKSGYFNSVACHLATDLKEAQIQDFFQIKEIHELEEFFGNEYQKKIEEFDAMNFDYIRSYQENLKRLKEVLSEQKKPLIEKLELLPDLLYWRKLPIS